jgi:hypothetical protein
VVTQNQLAKSFTFIREEKARKGPPPKSPQKRWLPSSVTSISKSVKKYAQVGLSRINAMPTVASDEDFASYVELIRILCERCQIFDLLHENASTLQASIGDSGGSSLSPEAMAKRSLAILLDSIDVELERIADFMRTVTCEIMMHDLEELVYQYMRTSTATFVCKPAPQNAKSSDSQKLIAEPH